MDLITQAARQSFEHLFTVALRANIAVQAGDAVDVQPKAAPRSDGEPRRTVVLLTSTSLRFKLVAMFQIVNEAGVRAYFGSAAASNDAMEVLFERGNLACGAMNRELQLYVPHVGLSTPSILSGTATRVMEALQAEHVSHFAVHINGDHLLDVSLCMRGQATVDFVANTSVAPAETGALELL